MDARAADDRWRSTGLLYAALFCCLMLIAFATLHAIGGQYLGAALLLSGLPFMAATIWGCRARPHMPRWTPYPLIVYLAVALVVAVHVWSAFDGTAMMWFCGIPPFAVFALGARQGMALSSLMLAVLVSGLVLTEHILTPDYAIRFTCAYLFIAGFTFAFEREREKVSAEVAAAQARIQTLEGMLRMCGWCHRRMRDETGRWVSTEEFFEDRAPVRFSHGLCPDCAAGLQVMSKAS